MALKKKPEAIRPPRALKIRTDDEVVVISGKDRGRTGKVLRVDPKRSRVYVEGLNIVKRHQRPSPTAPQREVGVIEREGPIHISNVTLPKGVESAITDRDFTIATIVAPSALKSSDGDTTKDDGEATAEA